MCGTPHLLRDVVEVADVMELLHLVSHRRREVRVCVAESAGRDSRHKVKIFLPGECERGAGAGVVQKRRA